MFQPRLRVFAGPNGSGKSTIIKAVELDRSTGKFINLGTYINADDIAYGLRNNVVDFSQYGLEFSHEQFSEFTRGSGLISADFTFETFLQSFTLQNNAIRLTNPSAAEKLAQIIARYLREKMLETRSTFSFETVFSHPSNVELMERAAKAGYKVYLYMVATASPEINKYRVALRVKQGGHNVPENLIESRYYRSLDLMYQAAQICHQAFFFDNSEEGKPYKLAAHFRIVDNRKSWDPFDEDEWPDWFLKYYVNKINRKR